MYQIGNLAIICAERSDLTLWIAKGKATVVFGRVRGWENFTLGLDDDVGIEKLIYELNHGSLRKETVNV